MTDVKSKPMPIVAQVYETSDYGIFRVVSGNRDVNQVHVKRLVASFREAYLFSPIIVNENYEVIDGQHRLLASQEVGVPVRFIICAGYRLKEVQMLNANSSNWKMVDYLNAYCDLGNKEYVKLKAFMREFPAFGIKACEAMLTGNTGGVNNKGYLKGTRKARAKNFENGLFVVLQEDVARDWARKLVEISAYYDGFNRLVFVSAMMQIFKSPNYSHEQFLSRLKSNPGALVHCPNVKQYKILVEELFNFRSHNKVSLMY